LSFSDQKTVELVKALMIAGLSLLFIPLVYHATYRCCCHDDKTSRTTSAIFYVVMSFITVVSGKLPWFYHTYRNVVIKTIISLTFSSILQWHRGRMYSILPFCHEIISRYVIGTRYLLVVWERDNILVPWERGNISLVFVGTR
jgi:hypothetical protein